MASDAPGAFKKAVSGRAKDSILSDFWYFLRESKKWWLLPLLLLLVTLGVLMMLGGTAAAPFIYTLF